MRRGLSLLSLLLFYFYTSAQVDYIKLSNGNELTGEIKSMERSILTIETDYSKADFTLDWDDIESIQTETFFSIELTNGEQYTGQLYSAAPNEVIVLYGDIVMFKCTLYDIVYLHPVEKTIISRFYGNIDFGWSLNKTNNLSQLNTSGAAGYRSEKWKASGTYNIVRTQQDSVEDINRDEYSLDYRYILKRNFYLSGNVSWLSNTEQNLDQRVIGKGGFGRYWVRSNSAYLGTTFGFNRNLEKFTTETGNRDTWESFLGLEVDVFDLGDLNMTFNGYLFSGITERARIRSDINLNIKYDLPFDLYIRLGGSFNYDNRPAENASVTDYVLQTGIGWKW